MKKKNKSSFVKLLKFVKPYTGLVVLSLLFALLSVGGTIYLPIVIKNVINLAVGAALVNWESIYPLLIVIVALNVIIALSSWLMGIINNKISFLVTRDLRKVAFKHIQHMPLSYLDTHSTGDILSRLIQDIETISDGLLLGLSQLFTGVLTIAGTIGFMFSLNAIVAALVVVLTPMSLFIARFISKSTFNFSAITVSFTTSRDT